MAVVFRSVKGSNLTAAEVDGNFTQVTGDIALRALIASPAHSGTGTGTMAMPATWTMVSTPSQADNSLKIATTAYVDTLGATKAAANAFVALTGANTLTQASHFNRHLSWTGGSTAAQALSGTATGGDYVEFSNDGTAQVTFTGVTAAAGLRLFIDPGETFYAIFTNGSWKSITSYAVQLSEINSQSVAYTTVMDDAGKTIFHPAADTTARVWTIAANASVAYKIGTVLIFDNDIGAGVITIAITSDTLVLVGTVGSTGSRTLAAGGKATAQKVTATRWRIDGNALT